MNIRRRSLLAGLATIPAIAVIAACGSDKETGVDASGQPTQEIFPVNFGYIPDFNGTSLLAVANDQKLWEKHGVEASLKSFTNGPLQIQAMGTGDLDFGYIGPGAMWLPASGKAKVVSINGTGQADRVIAQAGITSIQDLKGKKVAIPEGTSGDMIVQLALEKAGMTIDDIQKVAMDPSTVVAAFASKQVDAAGIWYPMIDVIKEQVPDLVELAKNSDFADTMAFPNVFVTGQDYPEKNPEALNRVLKVLRDAMDYRKENMDEVIQMVATMNKAELDAIKGDASNGEYYSSADLDAMSEDGTITKWFDAMSSFFADNGKIEGTPVVASEFYTGEAFVEAGK
ncbi:aliphatic sulfonate ABC transporter substrate-binding protein [Tessaracoccus antarcticus]|uniref:Aliphatic sulfonate ABC transporter substrate-binding protein n=1 Tax=Tessaracoccus antarcticus TaxID=2479848 RepID=A0A3M0GBK2_9ACTN|nr:aliphatic sulfonate ABC transporter substrate-binding protein [Tessaracoccus antarcticus]RMB62210.1 aliphatic sulfonate ABC transporter substrate-binding protein [Tessaracoccus antarcticus]